MYFTNEATLAESDTHVGDFRVRFYEGAYIVLDSMSELCGLFEHENDAITRATFCHLQGHD